MGWDGIFFSLTFMAQMFCRGPSGEGLLRQSLGCLPEVDHGEVCHRGKWDRFLWETRHVPSGEHTKKLLNIEKSTILTGQFSIVMANCRKIAA